MADQHVTRKPEPPAHRFHVGTQYARKDIFPVVGIADPGGGPWYTGYVEHDGDWYVFCGVGTPGRTGHDYGNHFDGDQLMWSAKGPSKLSHPQMQRMLAPGTRVYIFYRESERDPFTFAGLAKPVRWVDASPVQVVWRFSEPDGRRPATSTAEEIDPDEVSTVFEGARKTVVVNVYERDPNARRKCLDHWGTACVVCSFDFRDVYGDIGAGFIHVHHLKPLGEVKEGYELDPVEDLRPICPNCHAMLHRQRPALSIESLRAMRQAATSRH